MSNGKPRRRFKKRRIVALASTKRTTAIEVCYWNNAGLNMTTPPKMRDLAHRLLAYEAGAGKTSEPTGSATLRVYEKLRESLSEFAGTAGFQSLASRALALARPEDPSLSAVRVSADGITGAGRI